MTTATTELDRGRLIGTVSDDVAFFGGIPYAAPPVGELRFALPAPPTWSGERDARGVGPSAPQFRSEDAPFDLRCIAPPAQPLGSDYLNLNVWTPVEALDGPGGRAVMIFIHGGSFTGGSGTAAAYDAARFAVSGVVAVTISYRLGIVGFGHLDNCPDNRGFHDQLLAVRWVRENIAAFGGDPDQITIFGESAGSISVSALAACAPAGAFRRVISQSGGSHAMTTEQAGVAVRAVASRLGVEPTVAGLSDVDDDRLALELTMATLSGLDLAVGGAADSTMGLSPFGPVIDGELFTDLPAAMIAAGSGPDIDLMVGHNTEELNLYTVLLGVQVPDEDTLRRIVARLHPDPESVITAYREADRGVTPTEVMAAVGTDRVFAVPNLRMAQARLDRGGRAWCYEFGWRSPGRDGALGACHGIELPFVFDNVGRVDFGDLSVPDDESTRALAAQMHARWVGFARASDPGFEATSSVSTPYPLGGASVREHPERAVWDGVC